MLGETEIEQGDKSVWEQFYKRRRDLILLSGFIIFVNIVGVEVTSLNFPGTNARILRPELLPKVLAIVLTYVLLRYFQYIHLLDETRFQDFFHRRQKKFFEWWLPISIRLHPGSPILEEAKWIKKVTCVELSVFSNPWTDRQFELTFSVHFFKNGTHETRLRQKWVGDFRTWEIRCANLVALIYVAIRTPFVTEYIFPVFLAVVAFASYLRSVQQLFGLFV